MKQVGIEELKMKRVIKYLILLCLLPVFVWAQGERDTAVFHKVADLLDSYQRKMLVEKLYVHQDRMHYMAGETIWFKVYQSTQADAFV